MSGYTFILPWPAAALSPNARIDRRRKAEWVSAAHSLGLASAYDMFTKYAKQEMAGDLMAVIAFHPPDGRRRDLDNMLASMKPYLDGIFQALEIDDSRVKRTILDWGSVCPGGQVDVWVHELKR